MIQYLVLGITYAFAASIQPGPFQSFIISRTLSYGWKKTFPAVFAPLITDGPIIILAVFILNQVSKLFINILQSIGGLFLIFLAISALKKNRETKINKSQSLHHGRNILFQASIINFLNPSPYISWSLIMGPLFIKAWNEAPINGSFLIFGFYSVIVIMSIILISVFSSAKNLGAKTNRILIIISSSALGLFGIYQLWSASSFFIDKF